MGLGTPLWLVVSVLAAGCIQAEIGEPDPYGRQEGDPVVLGNEDGDGDRPFADDARRDDGEAEADDELPGGGGDEQEQPPEADPAACVPGATRACWPGAAEHRGVGACADGTETCSADGTWGACAGAVLPAGEACGNGVDEDCNGADTVCDVPFVTVAVGGACAYVTCPATHPFPVACDVQFSGTDDDGCVAWQAGWGTAYFQDGDDCDDGGWMAGTMTCGRAPGVLDEWTCILRAENGHWEDEPDDC